MTYTKPKLGLTDFLELIQNRLTHNTTLEQLKAGLVVSALSPNLREATARLMLDIVINLYDTNSNDKSNVSRIRANLEAVALQLEGLSEEVERLEDRKLWK